MTDEEIKREWEYRYQERLGMLGVFDGSQTMQQHDIAENEADKAIEDLKFQALVDVE